VRENYKPLVLFLLLPSSLAPIFWSWGWNSDAIAVGILLCVSSAWLVSAVFPLLQKYMSHLGATRQTATEARLVSLLKAISTSVSCPSLPLTIFLILMALSLHGLFLVVFVSLEVVYFLCIGILALVVRIGEKYPGVLSVLALALFKLMEAEVTTRTEDAAGQMPVGRSVPSSSPSYEAGYRKGCLLPKGRPVSSWCASSFEESLSGYERPCAAYPQQMPPREDMGEDAYAV
jgi:hypothetical protein